MEIIISWYAKTYGNQNEIVTFVENMKIKSDFRQVETQSPFGTVLIESYSPSRKNGKYHVFIGVKND